jgi:acetyl-CoA C-acetyltransferase
VHSTHLLGVDSSIVNAHGGAIALGHPIGASGTRIVGHLARRLAAEGSGAVGAAGICGGGGQGSAVVLQAL